MNSKTLTKLGVAGAVIVLGIVGVPWLREAWLVKEAVDHNIEARGGMAAWNDVSSLRYRGTMDIGAGVEVPFTLDQKVPEKSCMEYEFDGKKVSQCTDGNVGWKQAPFTGRPDPEPLTDQELAEASAGADPRGMLIGYFSRGNHVDFVGNRVVDDRDVQVLRVTFPNGAERTVYLDTESGLELKVEYARTLGNKSLVVTTTYSDWKATDGLLFARRRVTQTEGDDQSHAIVVKSVEINPEIGDDRFQPPTSMAPAHGND